MFKPHSKRGGVIWENIDVSNFDLKIREGRWWESELPNRRVRNAVRTTITRPSSSTTKIFWGTRSLPHGCEPIFEGLRSRTATAYSHASPGPSCPEDIGAI